MSDPKPTDRVQELEQQLEKLIVLNQDLAYENEVLKSRDKTRAKFVNYLPGVSAEAAILEATILRQRQQLRQLNIVVAKRSAALKKAREELKSIQEAAQAVLRDDKIVSLVSAAA